MVPPRNATRRRPPLGISAEVAVEVADHRVDLQPGVVVDQPGGRRPQELVAHVEGQVAAQRSLGGHGVEQQPGLVAGAGPQLDQGVGQRQLGHRRGVALQEQTLGPGRVVLGEPGDLLEEPAALLVVEPDRRDALRARPTCRCARPPPARRAGRRGPGGRRPTGRDQVARVLQVPGQADAAERPAGGGGEEVAVGGAEVARRGDARTAPQHVLVHHELAVVLADRTRGRAEARVGA